MFRVIKISDILDGALDEESMVVEDAFFFTIKVPNYYLVYNRSADIIGRIPLDYNMFFRIGTACPYFEDIDMSNLVRLYDEGMTFELVGTQEGSNKITLIDSSDIARFELVEGDLISIPFTNQAFDSEGIVIFKNMNSLADSIDFNL